jgi:hypothetical protein
VKKPDQTTRATNHGTGIRALGHVAAQAGQSEIRRCGRTTLFATDDVVHMKRKMSIFLMNQAVFAQMIRSLDDEPPQSR